jgi:Asp-tRNA(Asn)/Glu-tRNA(Gln) amidotransferase A subunit family amidase
MSGAPSLESRLGEWLARLAELEPQVHAFVEEPGRAERIEDEARALEARFPAARGRPALFGTLLGVKDVFRVDGLPTRAGSRLPPELFAGEEAASVTALRNAGALIAGKTVSTEFAYFAPGPTRNPAAPGHTPGGSSSGSAAAVAAGLCDLALGTQTIGSIGRPAAFCGVVGYKPSYDRIPRDGVIPLAPSLDHVGLFARSVAAIARASRHVVYGWRPGATSSRRPRLGVPRGVYLDHLTPVGRSHFEQTLGRLGSIGWEVARVEAMPDFDEIAARHRLLVAAEAAAVHAEWFARHAGLYARQTAELIERGRAASPAAVAAARAGRERLRGELHRLMDRERIDLWLSPPATGPAPRGLESTGDPVLNLPWTHAGLPTIVLPAGWSGDGLPMGLQVAARFGSDEELLVGASEIASHLAPSAEPGGRR